MVVRIKGFYEFSAFGHCLLKAFQIFSLVVFKRQGVEIFFFQHIADTGLFIKEMNDSLFKAMAFLPVYITCIPTVRAAVDAGKIIGRVSCFGKKELFF